jgi:hypothetical protein
MIQIIIRMLLDQISLIFEHGSIDIKHSKTSHSEVHVVSNKSGYYTNS